MKKGLFICILAILILPAVSARICEIDVPSDIVKVIVDRVNSDYMFRDYIFNVPPGYDIVDGYYDGWCFDWGTPIPKGVPLPVHLYTIYDLPNYLQHPNWNYVAYIINHKQSSDYWDVQVAIWYFINVGPTSLPAITPKAQAMIDDALQYGKYYRLRCKDLAPIIIDPVANAAKVGAHRIQYTFFEFPCGCRGGGGFDVINNMTIDINVTTEEDECHPPKLFVDPTARLWNPNDQTIYTADTYGHEIKNAYCYGGHVVDDRQNYFFTGETLTYFIAVYDEDGKDDITTANLYIGDDAVGQCKEVNLISAYDKSCSNSPLNATEYIDSHFNLDPGIDGNKGDYKFYACTLITQDVWDSLTEISVKATDGGEVVCVKSPSTVTSVWSDLIDFNPELAISLEGGPIDFGTTMPGSSAVSNTIYVGNAAEDGSGVLMDMYIASDDYFTDSRNPSAICGVGNGIRYDQFSYYATKGSINSGRNNNAYNGLGAYDPSCKPRYGNCLPPKYCICQAREDEFTPLPSHSDEIEDMCRIINHREKGSLLAQGAEMSVTFQLDVPDNCKGTFDNGQFHFVGRVV